MTANKGRWFVSTAVVALALLTGLSSEGVAQAFSDGMLYFKMQVKVPYALQDGKTVLQPNEYTLLVRNEKGHPVLSFLSKDGDLLMRIHGDYDSMPFNERDFKGKGRLRMMAVPDTKRPGARIIVFLFDFLSRQDKYVRFRFEIAEATEPKS